MPCRQHGIECALFEWLTQAVMEALKSIAVEPVSLLRRRVRLKERRPVVGDTWLRHRRRRQYIPVTPACATALFCADVFRLLYTVKPDSVCTGIRVGGASASAMDCARDMVEALFWKPRAVASV